MINISIDEKDKHVLRVTASYFLALAGDISADISGPDVHVKVSVDTSDIPPEYEIVPKFPNHSAAPPPNTPYPKEGEPYEIRPAPLLNNDPDVTLDVDIPSAASVFGGKSALSTAAVVQFETAPEVTPVTISTEISNAPVPPVPPVENAASLVVPPPPNHAPGVEVDSKGLPWDHRIHSREKTRLKSDNSWKYKRGVDDATIKEVEAQLRAVMAVPSPPPASTVTAPDNTETATPVSTVTASASDAPPPPPPPPPAEDEQTFKDLVRMITEAVTGGRTTQLAVIETIKKVGVESLPTLAVRPDLIPTAWKAIEDMISGVSE